MAYYDVYVKNLATGELERASVNSKGAAGKRLQLQPIDLRATGTS